MRVVFSSLVFLYKFLPICILLYALCPTVKLKNYVLVVMSVLFYAWGEPVYVFLLLASAGMNFLFGHKVGDPQNPHAKGWFIGSVVFNLGLLFVFKYTDFLLGTINGIFGTHIPMTGIALPIGISFYTFQTLSYVIDVRRGEVPVQRSFPDFLLFVSLFPQLIAGPILRYSEIAPQLRRRRVHIEDAFYGVTRFCIGLGKKVLIANYAGSVSGQLLGSLDGQTTLGVWLGVILFSLQLYFDFSGYSDMAIGLGRMFGFKYGENFDLPYLSKSATEFWRRWHISLGSFFRDYVYIPLGGNRRHQMLNLLVVWFLTGLWHGASWNFVLWGLFYGLLIAFEKCMGKYLEKIPAAVRHILMIFVILFGWTLFYFTDFSQLRTALAVMFGGGGAAFLNAKTKIQLTNSLLLLAVGIVGSTALPRRIGLGFTTLCTSKQNTAWNALLLIVVFAFDLALLLLSTVSLVGSSFNPFLYFRF